MGMERILLILNISIFLQLLEVLVALAHGLLDELLDLAELTQDPVHLSLNHLVV